MAGYGRLKEAREERKGCCEATRAARAKRVVRANVASCGGMTNKY